MNSGAGLDAQRATLQAEADRRGWALEFVIEEGLSAKDLNRPALVAALNRMDKGEADVLMVNKLDRLSRAQGGDHGSHGVSPQEREWAVSSGRGVQVRDMTLLL